MAYYDKKVIYLSYMEEEMKIKSAGFIKIENREGDVKLEMRISGLLMLIDGTYEVQAFTRTKGIHTLGKVYMHQGMGEWSANYYGGKIAGESVNYGDISEIKINLPGNKYIEGRIPEVTKVEKKAPSKVERIFSAFDLDSAEADKGYSVKQNKKEIKRENKRQESQEKSGEKLQGNSENRWEEKLQGNSENRWEEKLQGNSDSRWEEKLQGKPESRREEKIQGNLENRWEDKLQDKPANKWENKTEDKWLYNENSSTKDKEPELKAGSLPGCSPGVEEYRNGRQEECIKMEQVILNDKWQQLMQVYPVVHPYDDDRKYVSIEPKDFVIMTGDYQHLANNSFLLHGFYNYRHIVLGKEADPSDPNGSFYLGVPGVYYEREKMVALMFGFEAFECNGGRAEPGKFGYYLRKVKI